MKRVPIVQGEYRVVDEPNVLISTLLGSCIAVCLRDGTARVGGRGAALRDAPSDKPVLLQVQREDTTRYVAVPRK